MGLRIKQLLPVLAGIGIVSVLAMGVVQTQADEWKVYSFSSVTNSRAAVGTLEHPFRILEIVPNESMGMIGYMIDGCEPISMEKLAVSQGVAVQEYHDNIVQSGYAQQQTSVSYAFADALPADAEITTTGEAGKWSKLRNDGTDDTIGYAEFGYYEKVAAGNYNYSVQDNLFYPAATAGTGVYDWHAAEYYAAVGNGNGSYAKAVDANTGALSFAVQAGGNYERTVLLDTTGMDTTVQDVDGIYWTYRMDSEFYSRWSNAYASTDLFLNRVFGSSVEDGFVAEVVTITPDMLKNENLLLIDEADFIVMTAQTTMTNVWDACNLAGITRTDAEKAARPTSFLGSAGNDLSWEAALRIVERMASNTPAAMYLQQPALYLAGSSSGEYNVGKLYLMLMQYGAGVFKNIFIEGDAGVTAANYTTSDGKPVYGGVFTKQNANGTASVITNWDQETFLTDYGMSPMHEAALPAGVTGEVYDTILISDGSTGFLQEFLAATVQELISTNPDTPSASNSEMFDYYAAQTGVRPTDISMADCYKYVLINAQADRTQGVVYKDKLHILELQACNEFVYGSKYWQLYYISMFPQFAGSINDDVEVTTMTTYQFVGDITDLNTEYDLILIGSRQDATNGADGYNDTSMGNLIYTSVGDIVTTVHNKSWFWSNSVNKADGGASEKMGSDAYQIKARYSGTDITKKKYEELKDFLASGSPIVVDGALYSSETQVDTAKVDVSSYVYRIADSVYRDGAASMVFRTGTIRSYQEREALKAGVLVERCQLVFPEDGSGTPMAYSAMTEDRSAPVYDANGRVKSYTNVSGIIVSENYNTDTVDGEPVLRYTFTLQGSPWSNYGVKLYLDHNGDGVYNNSIRERMELLAADKAASNLNSTLSSEEANNERISLWDLTSQTAASTNNLVAGHTYQLIYRVRSTEHGILPWKLEVYDLANMSVRSARTGYTAFRVNGTNVKKAQIHVLQMNLMPSMTDETTTYVNFADTTTETGAKFAAYLDAVEDYEVNIEFMRNTDWYSEFGAAGRKAQSMGLTKEQQIVRWKEYLEGYDMLIIGFCDMTSFTSDEIFYEGFTDFVNQGKSVILSHDLVNDATFTYMHPSLTTDYDADIRTLSGQRRKYYIGDTNYYRYSVAEVNGKEISLLPPDNFLIWAGNLKTNQWYKMGKSDFMSVTESNIPAGSGYLTTSNDTWASGSTVYKMDCTNEFMDNSTRLMMSYSSDGSSLKKDRVIRNGFDISWLGSATTTYVEIANQGQITTYPYVLGDVMEVAITHCQNYQLDLEQEDGGDVTVWYNLTDAYDSDVTAGAANDGIYSSRSGDSRNNYYIYTKGNITYTGLGHRNTTLTNDEVKLFVNTMISSYRDVPDVPYAKVTNDEATEHDGTYTIYVVLTGAESMDDTIDVNLSVIDENDYNITSIRSYTLSCMDEDRNTITDELGFAVVNGSTSAYLKDRNAYLVQRNGQYTFKVPCQKVLKEGEAVYYFNVSSSYYAGTKEYTTSRNTKVVVYAMPLFTLN